MSAVLGPIHYWLYGKIQLQEEWLSVMTEEGKKAGWVQTPCETEEGALIEEKPLEELIDETNIHGWLQERIQESEARYARLVKSLLAEEPDRILRLEELALEFGKKHGLSKGVTMEDAYRQFENCLLNGMPCDRINQLLEKKEDEIIWEETRDIHKEYWIREGVDPSIYRRLRKKMMEGILWETDYQVQEEASVYKLTRKGK